MPRPGAVLNAIPWGDHVYSGRVNAWAPIQTNRLCIEQSQARSMQLERLVRVRGCLRERMKWKGEEKKEETRQRMCVSPAVK